MGKYDLDAPDPEPTTAGVPRILVTPATGNKYEIEPPRSGVPAEPPKDPWANFNKPFGELKPADLSPSEQARWNVLGGASAIGMSPANAQHAADAVMGVGTTLTPMGSVLSAADTTYHAPKMFSGDRKLANAGNTVLDVLGTIPGFNYARQGYRALRSAPGHVGGVPEVIPAHTAPFRETARAEPEIGGFVTPLPSEAKTAAREGYRAIEQAPIVYHPNSMADMSDWARNALPNRNFGPVFTPETAPNTFAMLERYSGAFPRGGPRPVNAYDFDGLRQQLLSQKGVEAAAGRQAADILDTYMLNPPKGGVLQGEGLLPALRQTYADTRGNWRGYKTGDAVVDAIDAARIGAAGEHSGKNLGNRTRQSFQKYVKTPEGEERLFGATPAQLDKIEDVTAGDAWTNALRSGSNRLGGGGGIGQTGVAGIGAGAGGGLAALMGFGPYGIATGSALGAAVPATLGGAMRQAANTRTAAAAQGVTEDIMRSTPLYRQNAAQPMNAPIADPRIRARDAVTMALMPGVRDTGQDWIDNVYTPYDYR